MHDVISYHLIKKLDKIKNKNFFFNSGRIFLLSIKNNDAINM